MSGLSSADAPLPSLWDDAHAATARRARPAALPLEPARKRPAHHQFRRRQHLGQDRRRRSADRRDGQGAVGEGLGRRHRLDEARRLLDALSRQAHRARKGLSRPRARGRDGRAFQPLHVQPQPARDLDRHAAARLRPARPRRPRPRRRGDRDRRERNAEQLTEEILRRRDGLPAVAAAGLRPRPQARRDRRRESGAQGRRARRPRPLHLGRDLEGLLRDDARA